MILKKNKNILIASFLLTVVLFFVFIFFVDFDFNRFKNNKNEKEILKNDDIVVVFSDKKFFPDVLNVKSDVEFSLILKTLDEPCDFVVDEINLKIPEARLGQDSSMKTMFKEKDAYEFYCSISGMKEAGAKGVLIVN